MPEYIESENALEFLQHKYENMYGCNPSFYAGYQFALENLKRIKSADVAPVVHAKWERLNNTQKHYCPELRDDLPFLICEVERAGTNNCPYTIYDHKCRMIDCLQKAQGIANSRRPLKTTKLQDIEKHYPELLTAILDTLKRPAFNEW